MKIDEARGNMRKGPFARIQSGEYFEDEKPDTKFFPADKKPKIEVKPEIPLKEEQVIQSIAEISDQELDAEDFERRAESHAKYQKALDLDQGDDDEEEEKEIEEIHDGPNEDPEGGKWFFIKWKGLSSIENDWMLEEECKGLCSNRSWDSIYGKFMRIRKKAIEVAGTDRTISKIRGEGRRKEHGEWKEKFLVKWKQWPFPLWEYYEDIRESKKAYEAFKEAKDRERQREKQEENQPMIIIDSDEEEEGVDNIIFRQIETSIFTKEVHPLTLHLTSITVGRTIRLYEVGMASVLNRGRDESFYSKAKYVDMQYMGAEREYLRERSGLSKSDFKGLPGKDWIAGANKFVECKLVEKVYKWLRANIRSGEPLWITIDSDSLALFQMKMRRYQGENQDWAWVVGGFTTWNRIKQLFRMVAPDRAGLIRPDNRSLKQYQEEELKLEHISGTAKDVALNMVTTVEKVALEHFIRHDLEEHFVQRETEKNWNFFANQTCLKGKKLKQHRGLKSFHERVELSDRYNGIYRSWTWDELEDLKRVVRRGNDLLPEKAPRKKVLPEGKWNIINEGRHTICPFNNCGLVQRIGLRRGLGSHLERDHQSESVRPRLCQVCGEIVSISDLETHAAQHSTMNYLMFWVVDKVTKEVVCPECPDLRHLNRFVMLRHMKDKHGWSEWKDPPGGPPLCWLCEEKVPLVDLNKHLHGHELKINFLMD